MFPLWQMRMVVAGDNRPRRKTGASTFAVCITLVIHLPLPLVFGCRRLITVGRIPRMRAPCGGTFATFATSASAVIIVAGGRFLFRVFVARVAGRGARPVASSCGTSATSASAVVVVTVGR